MDPVCILDHGSSLLSFMAFSLAQPFARRRARGNYTAGGRLDQFHLSLPKFHGYSYHLLSLLRFAFELVAMEVPLQRQKRGMNRNLSEIMVNISSEASPSCTVQVQGWRQLTHNS